MTLPGPASLDAGLLVWTTLAAAPAVGSFVGLLADRVPRGEDVVAAPSRCDACGARLAARDLVPIVSWLALGGRARCCGARLRAFLPGVELAAVGVALWAAACATGPAVPVTAALGWALLALALIDLRTLRLPDALTLPLLGAGLLAAAAFGQPVAAHAGAAALGYGLVAALGLIWLRLRGVRAIGMGDAKLLAAAGAWVGPAGLVSTLLWACGAGLLGFAAAALRDGPAALRRPAPFGPALALGLWLTWTLGPLAFAPGGAAP